VAALCVGYAIQTYRGREFRPLDALIAAAAGILGGFVVMRSMTRRGDRTRDDGTY
jgi:multisubunit Na+/H+ antiporter MnhB subunit